MKSMAHREPLTAPEARRRFEAMVALGTACHSPAAWRTMADLLDEAAALTPGAEVASALRGRARECRARADRSRALLLVMHCTVDHRAVKLDDAAWSALAFNGVQHVEADDSGPAADLEIRTCMSCGSTLARTIARAA